MPLFLDSLAILFIIIMGYSGFTKGFIEELGRSLGLIFAIFISMSKSASLANQLNEMINYDGQILLPFSYILLFIMAIICSRILTKFFHIAFLSVDNRLMNHSLGFLFGTFKGVMILITFVWLVSILPLSKWTNIINNNSRLITYSDQIRISIISFFNWEDPISLSESYIKELTQP